MQVTLIFGQWVYHTEVKDLHLKRSIELTGQSSQSPESTVGGNNINERKGGRELLLSFEGPAKWIFLGYIFYMILIVAIATTAVFYNHFEVNMHKGIQGFRSILAWIHLLGMNVGGATVTLTIAYAGLVGSGVIGTILSGGNITELKPDTLIMEQFIIPISIFAAVLVTGLIAGGLTFLLNYLGYKKKAANTIME